MSNKWTIYFLLPAMFFALVSMIGCHNDNTSVLENMVSERNLGATVGTATLSGNVIVNGTSIPINNAKVILVDGIQQWETSTDENGYFYFTTPLENKIYTLEIQATAFEDYATALELTQKSSTTIRMIAKSGFNSGKAGVVSGRVVDSFSRPISQATVTLNGSSTATDSDGIFVFSDISGGTYSMSFSANNKKTYSINFTNSGSDVFVNLNATLYDETVDSSMLIIDKATEKPIENAVVKFKNNDKIVKELYTDKNGMIFVSLPADSYSILVTADNYYDLSESYIISSNDVKVVKMEAKKATLSGSITDSSTSLGLEGVTVQLENGISTSTDSDGNYILYNISPKTHTVYFQKSNFDTITRKITFTPNDSQTINLSLYNSNPNSIIEGELYTLVNNRYSFLSTKNASSLTIQLYKIVGTADVPVQLGDNLTITNGYNFRIVNLTSGNYKISVNYIETTGDSNQPNGNYSYNSTLSESFTLSEGKTLSMPIVLTTQ